jgi:tetratricopeptide (TPR) repeat protein
MKNVYRKKRMMRGLLSALALALLALLASCSSAPKRPAEIYSIRQMGETQLDLVNKAADRGDYETALGLLAEARRLAVSADDPSLRARTKLAEGNICHNMGNADEAEAAFNNALAEAQASNQPELAAQTRVYLARSDLLTKKSPPDDVAARVNEAMPSFKKDGIEAALGWMVLGLAEKEKGDYAAAEDRFMQAVAIYAGANYLEQAAYGWYLAASARSVSGQYDSAIAALNEALAFDRRAENTYGLASDWRAIGDVYKKAGKTADSKTAYTRAAEIYRSINREAEAADAEAR